MVFPSLFCMISPVPPPLPPGPRAVSDAHLVPRAQGRLSEYLWEERMSDTA